MSRKYAIPITEATEPVRTALLRLGFKPYAYVTGNGIVRYACHRFTQLRWVLRKLSAELKKDVSLDQWAEDEN